MNTTDLEQKLCGQKSPIDTVPKRNRLHSDTPVLTDDFKDIPIIDLELYMTAMKGDQSKLSDDVRIECQKVAESFHKFGIIFVRDPRVDFSANDEYIDVMEDYFEQTGNRFYDGQEVKDIRPETNYQVGATPENIEIARDHSEKL
jgi:hypothetical protein